MKEFIKRQDRFEFFDSFENPLLNMCIRFECQNFLKVCKKNNIPSFHFFLYCISQTIRKIENFHYRKLDDEVIKIKKFFISYTVLNNDEMFNYADFETSKNFKTFLKRSLSAKENAQNSRELINTGHDSPLQELKNFTFVTCLPWLDFTSIEHPVYKYKSSDIPAIAWGKYTELSSKKLSMPLSIQAHHGFVDGVHIHLFCKTLSEIIDFNLSEIQS